jgi:hypothetical protein
MAAAFRCGSSSMLARQVDHVVGMLSRPPVRPDRLTQMSKKLKSLSDEDMWNRTIEVIEEVFLKYYAIIVGPSVMGLELSIIPTG